MQKAASAHFALAAICWISYRLGRNKEAIKKYIQNQLKEDKMADQMTIKEYYDPFTGEEYPKRNSDKINPFTDRKKK